MDEKSKLSNKYFNQNINEIIENDEVLNLFKESGALLKGHFLLTSGKHSDTYFEKIKLIENSVILDKIVDRLVFLIKSKNIEFDYVVSPAFGAIAIGFLAALKLGKKFAFTQRENEVMVLRSGFNDIKEKNVIVIEDIITTGGSILEVATCLKNYDVNILQFFVLIDRSKEKIEIDGKIPVSLTKVSVSLYEKENCPLCFQNIPLIKPGASNKYSN